MELAELIAARPVPCAGLLLTVTPRCPMSCAHCSASASMAGADPAAAGLRRFVESFATPPAGPAATPTSGPAAPVTGPAGPAATPTSGPAAPVVGPAGPAATPTSGPAAPTTGPAVPVAGAADGFPPCPEVLLMTGGEPMLRPDLVAELAGTARRAGTRSAVLTGGFFARAGRIPERIRQALLAVDHVSVSIDAFHEREVSRESAFLLLRRLLDLGIPVSVHAAGDGPDDPYLAGLVAATAQAFADQVPMLVNTIRPIGRAGAWAGPAARTVADVPRRRRPNAGAAPLLPCSMAAWPVVAGDGTVVACCNQEVVERRPVPDHLSLGHVAVDNWATVRKRALASPVLRMLRTTGPRYLWDGPAESRAAGPTGRAGPDTPGYCDSCRRLGGRPSALATAERIAAGPAGELLDRRAAQVQVAAGPVDYLRRHACARYAHLVAPPAGGPRRRPEVSR